MTNREYALLAGKTLSAKKAQDIVIIDIQGKDIVCGLFPSSITVHPNDRSTRWWMT